MLKARRDAYIERLNGIYANMLDKAGVDVVRGFGRFVGQNMVEVDGQRFTAPHIVIAIFAAGWIHARKASFL